MDLSITFSHLSEIGKHFLVEQIVYLISKTLIYILCTWIIFYVQNQTEDSIRKELIALQEDKHNYETTAKESLRRVLQEKIEVVRKLSEVEVLKFRP